MQNLTQRVIDSLNNLPGFPPKPTTDPPQVGQFILGDYLFEIHIRPESADFASLPATGNALGDIRASLADQAWYIWDGAAWQPMAGGGGGGNTAVDVSGYVAQEPLLAGDLVRFVNDAGTPKVQKADATNVDARLNPTGFVLAPAAAGAAVTVRAAGVASVPAGRFDVAPAVGDVGKRVFVSTTAGRVTLTAPTTSGLLVRAFS